MKIYLGFLAAYFAAAFLTVTAFAADAVSPAGTWKWTQQGRDGASWEQTLKLDYQDGKLTGTVLAAQRPMGTIPDAAISEGSFKDGVVAFSVTREFNGHSIVIKYEGKLEGDTIAGSVERPGRDGGAPQKRDWTATRVK